MEIYFLVIAFAALVGAVIITIDSESKHHELMLKQFVLLRATINQHEQTIHNKIIRTAKENHWVTPKKGSANANP